MLAYGITKIERSTCDSHMLYDFQTGTPSATFSALRLLKGQPSPSSRNSISACCSKPTTFELSLCDCTPVPSQALQAWCPTFVVVVGDATTVLSSLPENVPLSFLLTHGRRDFLYSTAGMKARPHHGGVPLPDRLSEYRRLVFPSSRLPNMVLRAGVLARIIPHRCSRIVQIAGFVSPKV